MRLKGVMAGRWSAGLMRTMLALLLGVLLLSCSAQGQLSSPAVPTASASPSATASPTPNQSVTPPPSVPATPVVTSTPVVTETPTASPSTGGLDLAEVAWFQVGNRGEGAAYPLFVGRLDGRAFEALAPPDSIEAAGPVDGQVLAWWRDGAHSVMALVDTGDGSSRELLRTEEVVEAAVFGTSDDWYWVTRAAHRDETLGVCGARSMAVN